MRSDRWPRASLLIVLLVGMARPGGHDHAEAGTLVERTVAFVNKKAILLSDVALTRALLQLEEPAALDRTIDESLMFEEASRLLSGSAPEESIANAVLTLQEKAGTRFSAAAFRRKALVQLAISNYINLRLRPLVRVEDSELRKAFNERVVNEGQPEAFGLVAPSIREALERRSLDQKIEEWVSSLRLRADIRRPLPRP